MTQTAKKSPFSMNVDLMHGPIFKNLLLFMLPIFISSLFQQLYNTVDTMIVGNVLGDTALAAIGSCGSIYELLVGFGLGIGNGLAIVAARSYGAQDHDLLKKTVAGSLVIGLAASLCITLAGVLGLHPLLLMLDTPAEILDDAYRYILTIDLGVLVMFAYNLCAGLLRAIGNSVMPLVFLLISSGLNVVLDLLFIARMGMGVEGAAVATVISLSCTTPLAPGSEPPCPASITIRYGGSPMVGRKSSSSTVGDVCPMENADCHRYNPKLIPIKQRTRTTALPKEKPLPFFFLLRCTECFATMTSLPFYKKRPPQE